MSLCPLRAARMRGEEPLSSVQFTSMWLEVSLLCQKDWGGGKRGGGGGVENVCYWMYM